MKKVLFVATVVKTHINVFHLPYLKMLHEKGWEVDVAAKNDFQPKELCEIPFCDNYYDIPFERNPFKLKNIKAYRKIKSIIKNKQYDIIHCHTPVGGVIARLAAVSSVNTKVIYTAHGFHFYTGAPILNWIVYYPIEWACSWITDTVITINKEDYQLAKKNFHAKKIKYVPGVGVDLEKYKSPRVIKRNTIGVSDNAIIIITVGELNENKNQSVIIKAVSELVAANKDIYYVLCGKGEKENDLKKYAIKCGIENNVIFLGYTNKVESYLQMADIFAFPSKREGLGLAVIEAMATGLPVVASNIRGIMDYSVNGQTGYYLNANDVDGFEKAIQHLISNREIRLRIGEYNKTVVNKYDVRNILHEIEEIYMN